MADPIGIPQPQTWWNPNGAPRLLSAEAEQYLKQLELESARNGHLSTLRAPPLPALSGPTVSPLGGVLAQNSGVLNLMNAFRGSQGLNSSDSSWLRPDGSRKGQGFLGPLKFKDGRTSTELSIGVNLDGKEMEIPSLVPTLTGEEIAHLMNGGEPHEGIVQKAVDHARLRMSQNLPVFAP